MPAGVAGTVQAWQADGWAERFALPFDVTDHGFGHTREQVAAVAVDGALLTAYHDAVHARSVDFLESLTDHDLARVVDKRWDPPVTMAVRLVSVVDDCAQHVGQAAFVRGWAAAKGEHRITKARSGRRRRIISTGGALRGAGADSLFV